MTLAFTLLAVVGAMLPAARAQTTEFQVNTYTDLAQSNPSVAVDDDGDSVVAWSSGLFFFSGGTQDGDGNGIFAQRFGSDGAPRGAEFQVNTYFSGNQERPAVAIDADGDFVVAWESDGQDDFAYGVFAQRYAADGSPRGAEFQVNTNFFEDQFFPSVGMTAGGDFVIVWEDVLGDGQLYGVRGQRYASDGTRQGGEFLINTTTEGIQRRPSVAVARTGEVVVAWESNQGGASFDIYAQRFAADGGFLGAEFRVNTLTTDNQREPAVALGVDGGFTIVWESTGQDGDGDGIYGQRFAPDGARQGGNFRVNTTTASDQRSASVAAASGGGFVVVWQSDGQDGEGSGVYGQRFGADGAPLGSEFRINTVTPGDQSNPAIGTNVAGAFTVAWDTIGQESQEGDPDGIYARRFSENGSPVAAEDAEPVGRVAALSVWPNPSRGSASGTTVQLTVGANGPVQMAIYDPLGRRLAMLFDGIAEAGSRVEGSVPAGLAQGVYLVQATGAGFSKTVRLTVLR